VGLRRRGLDVLLAEDGEAALRLAQAERPDLVLLDLLMPKMNGVEFLRALRTHAETGEIPVLVLSNSSREQDLRDIARLGVAGYWVKTNMSLQELGDRVVSLLGPRAPHE
jgi:CheY-like chemotaxis protein